MSPIQWADEPSRDKSITSIEHLKKGQREKVRLLDRPRVILIHWLDRTPVHESGRSIPCLGSDCPPRIHTASPCKSAYYAAVLVVRQRRWVKRVLQLSYSMFERIKDLDPSQGVVFQAVRREGWRWGQVEELEYPQPRYDTDGLNVPFDIEPTLNHVADQSSVICNGEAADGIIVPFPGSTMLNPAGQHKKPNVS